jgi:uncharacterized protein
MKNFNAIDWLALAVLAIGGINWGLIGVFSFDLVSSLFGDMTTVSRIVYGLVGVSAIYMLFSALMISESAYEVSPKSRVLHP